jgi:hypothetical protein
MHVVLLGDSIFDNASYVPRGGSVIEHLRSLLPDAADATLLAVDGASSADAIEQVALVPKSSTHLFLSCGGNDALNESYVLDKDVRNVRAAVQLLAAARLRFAAAYERLLDGISSLGRPVTVCTVYDAIPVLSETERTALTAFNDVVLRAAFSRGADVLDLRLICADAGDYSDASPIEPSAAGAAKIARAVLNIARGPNNSLRLSNVYG